MGSTPSLTTLASWVMSTFPEAKREPFGKSSWRRAFHERTRSCLGSLAEGEDLILQAASGQGSWAEVPWIGLRHEGLAKNFNSGVYVALLFHPDGGGVSLSLQQGITRVREELGMKRARAELRRRAVMIRSAILVPQRLDSSVAETGGVDRRARLYREAHICGTSYAREECHAIDSDFRQLVDLYLSFRNDRAVVGVVNGANGDASTKGPVDDRDFDRAFQEPIKALALAALDEHRSVFERTKKRPTLTQCRIGQRALRLALLRVYDRACVACGLALKARSGPRVDYCLHAAHVIPVELGGGTLVRNGLLLCPNHHWAFDHHCFSLDDNGRIIVPKRLNPIRSLVELDGRPLIRPKVQSAWLDIDAIRHHRRRAELKWSGG